MHDDDAFIDSTTSVIDAADLATAALALARRFTNGATMWAVSPRWPHHARHVAVEFVHPVIMGTRALPAFAVAGADVVAGLRAVVRAGDVVVAIGPAADVATADVVRRARTWGATTVWVGAGPRPAQPDADHVLWTPVPIERAPHDGALVRIYHLLWELTHVCFEHPGLMRDERELCTDDVCVTCSDEGRPGEVIRAEGEDALVRTAHGVERVDVTLVAPVRADDLVLVHAGTAIARLEDDR